MVDKSLNVLKLVGTAQCMSVPLDGKAEEPAIGEGKKPVYAPKKPGVALDAGT
jgi:hypothetical protein